MKVWDLHCDTLSELRRAEKNGTPASFAHNDLHIDLEKLQAGDYMLQCLAAFVNLADPTPGADPLVTALEEIDVFKRIMAKYPDRIAPVYTAADIRKNAEAGKISGLLTVEEGGCCKGSLGVLRRMYELGVRMMTLTWNHDNELAAPQANPGGPLAAQTQRGLTETGFAFLAEMERLHMIVDVSHLSDRGFWDIVEHGTRPFAASHSNCRALCPHTRNLTDAMIRALAEKGGIAGLNYYAAFLDTDPAHPEACRSTVERIAEHAAHYKQVGGIGVLALGSDFDGMSAELNGQDLHTQGISRLGTPHLDRPNRAVHDRDIDIRTLYRSVCDLAAVTVICLHPEGLPILDAILTGMLRIEAEDHFVFGNDTHCIFLPLLPA